LWGWGCDATCSLESGGTGGRGRTGRSPRGAVEAPASEIGGGTPGSLALPRPGFLGLEQWQSTPSLQRQTWAGRQRMSPAIKEKDQRDTHLQNLLEKRKISRSNAWQPTPRGAEAIHRGTRRSLKPSLDCLEYGVVPYGLNLP
jgi:hypothetical protein